MDITFKCDICGQDISIDQAGAGSLVECPKCKASVMVPVSSGVTGQLPLLPRPHVTAAPSKVIVEKIQGLPLQVEIVGVRVSWREAWDVSVKVFCCLSAFTLLLAVLAAIVAEIVNLASQGR